MHKLLIAAGVATVLLAGCQHAEVKPACNPNEPAPMPPKPTMSYPASPTVDHVDVYHGTQVADPYRWLEEDSEQTKTWVNAQREFAEQYLARMPARDDYKKRLTTLWNYERYSTPTEAGGRYFYYYNNGLQNQSVLYVQEKNGEARVLLDPNTLSADGTVALSGVEISKNGRYIAYGVSKSGSDWQTWAVRDVRTGKDLNDNIEWVKFSSAAWTPDEKGFYYARYDAPKAGEELSGQNYFQKLYYHKIGTPQSADILVYHRPDQKEWGFGATVSDDGKYLVIPVWQGTDTRNRVFYKALTGKDRTVKPLIDQLEADYEFIGNDGSVFYFKTDLQAPRGRIIAIDVNKPATSRLKEVVPQTDNTLRFAMLAGNRFVLSYLKDAISHVEIRNIKGALEHTMSLPSLGTAGSFNGKRESHELFYTLTSYVQPTTVYRLDLNSKTSTVYREPKVDFNANEFVSEQIFYTSKDGTRVPMIISYKKGLQKTGKNPTILYGYGGFNIALSPSFNAATIAWLERGGVYAVANLRGGGEYGEPWHKAGTKGQKQNVFDDFVAAAEWLIKEQYTSSSHLGIHGGSNGGLLVGAAMTQRPDLFGAAVPAVGVLDMLRFQKFTIGWAWTSDYGSSDNAEDFPYLYAYSPLHNVKDGAQYPATMVMTADHDDRVVPYHSFKFAARLQAANASSEPMLIRIESKAGHGAGKPISKQIEDKADFFAFLEHHLK
ncbi:prolyl oligopeptidase family serine peptidase [Permianibacter aggregans]|uniref:prolyl oligopeptidase n=1 Tax=Permianibacter aggregans TaxID=1510150 RepID=A0A4R6UQS5_9GAMM|nr:prolyl oligopeptidase family serine peptidase [Permianibacter aggregans]TDQ47615.1 prolyl oligopeptidase [Permianibacter aggregans]